MDNTAIATLMNCTSEEVMAAVTAMEKWKAVNSRDIVEASMNEQVMIAIEPLGRTLVEAQMAKRLVAPEVIHPKTGEVLREAVYVPDHATRIAATEAVAKVVESVKDRGPGVQVNVGGNQLHMNGGGGRSFEERLRMQREERGMRDRGVGDTVTIDVNTAGAARDGSDEEDDLEDEDDDIDMDDDDNELADEDDEGALPG